MLIRDLKSWFDERLRICISLSLLFSCQQEGANDAFSKSNRIQTAGGGTTSTTESPSSTPSISASSTFSITSFSDRVFPVNALAQGSTLSLDWNNITSGSPGNDTGMTYSCVYDRVVDSAVTAGTSCSSLAGTASFDTTTGAFSWMPDVTVWGSFELKVTGTSGSQSSIKYLAIAVRPNYVTSNLIGAWDAQFADSTQSVTGNYLSWKDLSGNSNHGSINNSTNASWSGSGTASSPYAVNFNGSGSVDFGTTGSSSTKMMFSGWVNPSNTNSSSESVIIGNSGNATGNGFTVRQKPSYRDVVMSLNPVGYWRLGETTGTTAVDLGSGGNNGTYTNGPTLAQLGGLTSDEDKAVSFDGTNDEITTTLNPATSLGQNISVAAWIYPTANGNYRGVAGGHVDSFNGITFLQANGGVWSCGYGNGTNFPVGSVSLTLNAWSHVVAVYSGSSFIKIYVNGVLIQTQTQTTNISHHNVFWIGKAYAGADRFFQGAIDDLAVFNSALNASQISTLYEAGSTGKKIEYTIGKTYKEVVLSDNPAAYWRLNESTGTTLKDFSGSGNNGTSSGGVTLGAAGAIAGDSSSSTLFNGTTGSINVENASTALSLSNYTVEGWFSTSQSGVAQKLIYRRPTAAGNINFGLYIDDVTPNFFFYVGATLYTVTSSVTISTNQWYHLAGTWNGTILTIYVNGVQRGTATPGVAAPTGVMSTTIGADPSGGGLNFQGKAQDIAVYATALNSSQILTHYNAGIGTYGGSCTGTSGFSTSTWNFISGLFDGSTASFYVNGRQECTVTSVPQRLNSASTNLTSGSTSTGTKGWIGYLADLLLYGTSDGSAVGTAANVKTNFDATADRYRQTPVGNIVTNGLVLNLDAANANQGLRSFANGCASTDLNWFDLSSSALTGILTNFASCSSTTGWNGDGTLANPYRLTFDGSSDVVSFGDVELVTGNTISVCTWFKASSIAQYSGIVGKTYSSWQYHLGGDYDPGTNKVQFNVGSIGCMAKSNNALNDSAWHYLCGVYDGSLGSANAKLYVDGTMQTTTANCTGNIPNTVEALKIGAQGNTGASNYFFTGSISQAVIYNTALTSSQVSQNCNAHKARYSSVTCN